MTRNRMKTVFVICLFVIFGNTNNSIGETHEVLLNEEFDFKFKWRIDGEDILIEMSADTLGYVAIGFSPNGGMPGSDIVVGWVKNDQTFLSDRHAKTYSTPEMDASNDYDILYGFEEGVRTTIGFKRTLNTCDDDDYVISSDTARVIWAVNDMDPEDIDDLMYHGSSRGVRSVVLLNAPKKLITLPEDVNYFELFMPNLTVPSDSHTTYWCTSFAVPVFDNPVHVVRFKTIVQEGHDSLVHHVILYGCNSENVNWSSNCLNENMPPDLQSCRRMIYAWAIGGSPMDLPDHVGLSLGMEDDPTLLILEIHYDNPDYSADFHDNSGVRIYYTPTLRQYEAEIWTVGENVSPLQSIPPNEIAFKTFGFCFGDCTKQDAHFFIKAKTTTPVGGVFYGRGDEFAVTCTYNTMGREYITTGGLSTTEEMCLAFLMYYPRQSTAGDCVSSPVKSAFFNTFNIEPTECFQCLFNNLGLMEPGVLRDGLLQVSYESKRENYCRDVELKQIEGVQLYHDFPVWFSENDRVVKTDVCTSGSVSRKFVSLSLSITLLLSSKLTL